MAINLQKAETRLYKKNGTILAAFVEQFQVLEDFQKKDWYASFCSGADEAITLIDKVFHKRKKILESDELAKICEYLRTYYPSLVFISDLASYSFLSEKGKSSGRIGADLRSSYGIPDLFIFEPFELHGKKWHGMALEIKRAGISVFKKDGTLPSKHLERQFKVIQELRDKGYYADFCSGANEAMALIDKSFSAFKAAITTPFIFTHSKKVEQSMLSAEKELIRLCDYLRQSYRRQLIFISDLSDFHS